MGRTGVSSPEPWFTVGVLEAETGLVSLCYLYSRYRIEQVIVTEGVHAVVVPEGRDSHVTVNTSFIFAWHFENEQTSKD